MSAAPTLYKPKQQSDRTWAVVYKGDDSIACFVTARQGEPDDDAKHRAYIIADALNATVDMTSGDVGDLLAAFEKHHNRRHHADWR